MSGNDVVYGNEVAHHEPGQEKKPLVILSDSEKEIVELQLNGLPTAIDAQSLWSYTTAWDKTIIIVSVAAAILGGASNPLLTVSRYTPVRK